MQIASLDVNLSQRYLVEIVGLIDDQSILYQHVTQEGADYHTCGQNIQLSQKQ